MIKSKVIFCLFYLKFIFASHSNIENLRDKIQDDLKNPNKILDIQTMNIHVFFFEDSLYKINSAENLRFEIDFLSETLSKLAFSKLLTNNFSLGEEKSCKKYCKGFSPESNEVKILFILLDKINQEDMIILKKCTDPSIYLAFLNTDGIKQTLGSKDFNIASYHENEIVFKHININELIMIMNSEILLQDCNPTISQCKNCTQANPQLCDQCNSGYYLNSFGNECCISSYCNTCPENNACNSCMPGYYLKNSNCLSCPEGCSMCQGPDLCLACYDQPNSFLFKNMCFCKDTNAVFYNNKCECNSGFFSNNGICSPCGKGCSICLSETNCITCFDDMDMANEGNGECRCIYSGYEFNEKAHMCACPKNWIVEGLQCVKNNNGSRNNFVVSWALLIFAVLSIAN